MEPSSNSDLPESIFFTARKARIRSSTHDATSSSQPASSEYYSARIHSIMERKSELAMSEEDAEIEASKDHWTVVEPDYFTAATTIGTDSSSSQSVSVSCSEALKESERISLYEKNVREMQRLQEAHPGSRFFRIGDDGPVLGRKIGEGGQAEIYDAGHSTFRWATEESSDNEDAFLVVLKVFKAGYLVRDLQRQWPLDLLHKFAQVNEEGGDDSIDVLWNPMLCGRLLADGRFAFEMFRFWGDLRKLLDVRMQHNGNRHPPFMMPDGNYHECCMLCILIAIALGMRGLHREGTLHKDLKASNVLVLTNKFLEQHGEYEFDPLEMKHDIGCVLTDYECSMGIVGTGYWRAPEILEALKNRRNGATPNLSTPKSDVYSFAMTCYEVLTGLITFEEVGDRSGDALVDDVINGRRPTLPSHLKPLMVELMNKCWHMDPLKRPPFEEICNCLDNILKNDLSCQNESTYFKKHDGFDWLL